MKQVAVVHHGSYGHTERQAKAVVEGAAKAAHLGRRVAAAALRYSRG